MANRQAFVNYLQSVGFPLELRQALIDQGVDNITSFLGMTDSDVDDLCSNIRRPGGLIPNPLHVNDPDAPELINDPGVAVGRIYQERLKQIAYYYSYLVLVGRNFVANNAEVTELVRLWKYKKNIENTKQNRRDGEERYPEKFSNVKTPREFIETIENWIDEHYGIDDIPLAYVVREDADVPRVADDPLPLGQPTFNAELTRRAAHTGEAWAANNSKVWQMIRHVTHGTDAWAFVKNYSRSQNGRDAFFSLKSHYMGADFVNKVKLSADAQLETLNWNGKARNFTWEKFISRLTSAFADLAENGEPKSESEKVRKLLRAISDPTLNVAKAVVQGDVRYAEDFQAACSYLAGQLSSAEATNANRRNISEVSRGGERSGRGRGRFQRGGRNGRLGERNHGRGRDFGRGRDYGRGRGRGRYSQSGHLLTNGGYPAAVWDSFSSSERAQVYQMREAREENEKRKAAALTRESIESKRQREENSDRGIGATMTRRESQLSSLRRIVSSYSSYASGTTRCELDSHADTCAFGKHAYIMEETSQAVSVAGFHPDMKEIDNVKIVTAAVAYDCPFTLVTYVLIFPQSLYFPRMNHNLICPDQLREFGLTVNEFPCCVYLQLSEHHKITPLSNMNPVCMFPSNMTNRYRTLNAGNQHEMKYLTM